VHKDSPRLLSRVLKLFDVLASEPDGVTLSRLSVMLDAPKSSLLTFLRPLVADNYLTHQDRKYALGPEMYRLGTNIVSARRFTKLMRVFLEELVEKTGETAVLATLDYVSELVFYQDVVEGSETIRYAVPFGVSRQIYSSSAGRVLLAYADEEWREHYLRHLKPQKLTDRSIVNKAKLREVLTEVRAKGYAVTIGETVKAAAGIAAPVFDGDGTVRAALLIGAPVDRVIENRAVLVRSVIDTAAKASRVLGYTPVNGRRVAF